MSFGVCSSRIHERTPKDVCGEANLTWENSQHLTTPRLVSPRNDVWQTSTEIPYWWRVSTQIWVVLLIGWEFASSNQKHYRDLGSFYWLNICFIQSEARSRGPFLERVGNFSGPKANFEIKTCWIVARFPAHKPVNLALLTDSFIASFLKLLKLWSWMQTRQTSNSFPGPKSSGAPNVNFRKISVRKMIWDLEFSEHLL